MTRHKRERGREEGTGKKKKMIKNLFLTKRLTITCRVMFGSTRFEAIKVPSNIVNRSQWRGKSNGRGEPPLQRSCPACLRRTARKYRPEAVLRFFLFRCLLFSPSLFSRRGQHTRVRPARPILEPSAQSAHVRIFRANCVCSDAIRLIGSDLFRLFVLR